MTIGIICYILLCHSVAATTPVEISVLISNEGLSNMADYAACQFISELPVCPNYTVYTSQAGEQDNKTHLTWPKRSCAYWL